ncbi:MAG TPA: phosphoribosylanthranilate isomerase [Terriglobia bacterium]|nr:phosphoribosylanthranilate isomerase [Terriglobia bacterium]
MTRIKICGITRPGDAELAVELGASALGFNFYRPSPRYISPEAAREIIGRAVPPPAIAVGVFADETDTGHVVRVARTAGVSAIQLHGPRFPRSLNGFRWPIPVIRAVTVDESFVPQDLEMLDTAAFLLDAYHPDLKGGTGRTVDWAKAREAASYARVILAGGLTPENVAEAIRQVRPFAVDVASGVESAPGVKDASKLRAFFAAVRAADER